MFDAFLHHCLTLEIVEDTLDIPLGQSADVSNVSINRSTESSVRLRPRK